MLDKDDTQNDEINLRELFDVLWAGKFKIIAITCIFAVASVYYALSIPNQYKALTLLAPAQSSQGGLSGGLGQLGGLASLAGVSIGSSVTNEAQIALEIMQSWSFIEGFIKDNDLEVEIFAAEDWDQTSNDLKINNEIFNTENEQWLIKDQNGIAGPPSSWDLYKKFKGKLSVSQDKLSGLVLVSIEYYSPQLAKQWLDMYVKAINEYMQQRQIFKVTNNINYLNTQIEKTPISEMQEVFYSIIEEQIKSKMLAEASPDYAFVAVNTSMVPHQKSQPTRSIICIIITLIGGLLSVTWVLLVHFTRKTS